MVWGVDKGLGETGTGPYNLPVGRWSKSQACPSVSWSPAHVLGAGAFLGRAWQGRRAPSSRTSQTGHPCPTVGSASRGWATPRGPPPCSLESPLETKSPTFAREDEPTEKRPRCGVSPRSSGWDTGSQKSRLCAPRTRLPYRTFS